MINLSLPFLTFHSAEPNRKRFQCSFGSKSFFVNVCTKFNFKLLKVLELSTQHLSIYRLVSELKSVGTAMDDEGHQRDCGFGISIAI